MSSLCFPLGRSFRLLLYESSLKFISDSFGLSYTSFLISNISISGPSASGSSFTLEVSVEVTNTGSLVGSEVVQIYISLPDVGVTTPNIQLKGFSKVKDLEPGLSRTVTIELDKYAVSFWDTPRRAWSARAGEYTIFAGNSSDDLPLRATFSLQESFEWTGL